MNAFQLTCTALLVFVNTLDLSNGGIFLTRPGDGEEYVYSPVKVNATLSCVVNNTFLLWGINETYYNVLPSSLTSRGIFLILSISSDDRAESSLLVMGNINKNNDTRICCRAMMGQDSCTTLIIYDRPSPPENVSVRYLKSLNLMNISWSAKTMSGVHQTYQINLKVCRLEIASDIVICVDQNNATSFESTDVVETKQLYYFYQQNTSDSEIRCIAYVTAVNGAGESDPSNNVTIPSLPDIGPVTASLSHQVWKSADGEIMVNVSFKPALHCEEYPVISYVFKLRSAKSEHVIERFVSANTTRVLLYAQDGLKGNQEYVYTVSATNIIGNMSTPLGATYFFTSDVQSVTATVVRESTIDIQCLFIHGSDAVGCKVVLVSDHPGVNNETETLLRKNTSAFGQLNLTLKAACYHRVLAYTFYNKNSTNNFYIEEILSSNYSVYTKIECSGSRMAQAVPIIIVIIVVIMVCLFVVVIVVISFFAILKKKGDNGNCKSQDDVKNNCYVSALSTNYQADTKHPEDLTQNDAPPLQDAHLDETLERSSPTSLIHSPTKSPLDSVPNTNEQTTVSVVSTDSVITPSRVVPLYAVPEKVKAKRDLESNLKAKNVESDCVDNEENFYHVLENDVASSKDDDITTVPLVSPPLEKGSALQAQLETKAQNTTTSLLSSEIVGGNLTATNDSIGGNKAAQTHTVPVYAVPDKFRSKNQSVFSQSNCDAAIRDGFGENDNAEQEHVYHILENTKAPCKGRATPPDSNAPDLPPPFKPGTPPSDPSPVYQDITEINMK